MSKISDAKDDAYWDSIVQVMNNSYETRCGACGDILYLRERPAISTKIWCAKCQVTGSVA